MHHAHSILRDLIFAVSSIWNILSPKSPQVYILSLFKSQPKCHIHKIAFSDHSSHSSHCYKTHLLHAITLTYFLHSIFSLSEIISLYVNMHVVYLHHQWFHLPESRNCVTLFTPIPLELGMVLNWWMHYAVDAGPFWNRMQLAAIANYKTIGFHPSLHNSQDHKAEDTQPFLIIP